MSSEVKLAPCPLCHSTDLRLERYGIGCRICGLWLGSGINAAEIWNTRQPSPALSVAVEALERIEWSGVEYDHMGNETYRTPESAKARDALAKIKGEVGECVTVNGKRTGTAYGILTAGTPL